MNPVSHSLTRQRPEGLAGHPKRRDEALDVGRTDCPRSSVWKDAWIDCLIQATAATPWIIASAIGRRLLQGHG
jgi:hypothetical protein